MGLALEKFHCLPSELAARATVEDIAEIEAYLLLDARARKREQEEVERAQEAERKRLQREAGRTNPRARR